MEFIRDKSLIQIGGPIDKKLKPIVLRIGHMSEKQCETRNLITVISAIGDFMKLNGINVLISES